ncbi:hypothetical protein BSKO_08142 [Bryopsis sp. KO-2023]|nr:hypothetical protein BSKO_08142 [Bryopsis sp. KO-2023]
MNTARGATRTVPSIFSPSQQLSRPRPVQPIRPVPGQRLLRHSSRQQARLVASAMPETTEIFGQRPVYHYFNLPHVIARGGTLRLFLYLHGVEFDEGPKIDLSDWAVEKKKLMDSGVNPAGHLPYLEVGERKLTGHVTIMRYVERKLGLYGQDPESDFTVDEVADEYTTWRASWADAAFGGSEEVAEKYKTTRDAQYKIFECYYARRSNKATPFLLGGDKPRFADVVMFAIMHDDQTIYGEWDYSDYPCLEALFTTMKGLPVTSKVLPK